MSVGFRPDLCPKCKRYMQGNPKDPRMLEQEFVISAKCKRPAKGKGKPAWHYVLHTIEPHHIMKDCKFFKGMK